MLFLPKLILSLSEKEVKFGKEILEKHGEEKINASNGKYLKMSKEDFQKLEAEHEKVVDLLNKDFPIKDKELACQAIEIYRDRQSHYWTGQVTPEAHKDLSEMYVKMLVFVKTTTEILKVLPSFLEMR